MINEMREVLARDKFGLTEEELRTMVDFAIRLGSTTIVKSNSAVVKDPDDDVVISAACDGKAAYVVSGDRYALEAKEFAGIRIVKAGETLKLMGKPQQWRYGRTILLRVGVAYSG
jgi:predicted nucleic acid-binding protein